MSRLGQFYHDPDSETSQRVARLCQDDTATDPLCHQASNLTPNLTCDRICHFGRADISGIPLCENRKV